MGDRRLKDNTVLPLSTVVNIGPANVIPNAQTAGVIPVGVYKGTPAFLDLDKIGNQPLVSAEKQYILGILDGREEGHDLLTLTTVVGATSPIGTVLSGSLAVPAGQVYYINAVRTVVDCTGAANGLVGNWNCNLWTDRAATPNPAGQGFRIAGITVAAGATTTTLDEFGPIATVWQVTNKPEILRLPAGAIITYQLVTTTAQVDVAAASTLQLFGWIGKTLVA